MTESPQLNICFTDIRYRLASLGGWPDQSRFPLNLLDRSVREQVLQDIRASSKPLIVTGFASLDRIIELLADIGAREDACLRLLLGNEPFESRKKSFVLAGQSFSNEVREYWLRKRISLYLSAQLICAIDGIDAGRIEARYLEDSTRRLHAKMYRGDTAVTLGSSNFTKMGLSVQLEANARFDQTKRGDKKRFTEAADIAENFWRAGTDYTFDLRKLLEQLLRVVPWQEALARACAELLEGAWAQRYLEPQLDLGDTRLWLSQRGGIAQALWILENIGSVLVADATGSGKTRMGAHLLRALRDRVWSTGRTRSDLSVLVCPPPVQNTWGKEAINCGLPLQIRSHGTLGSRNSGGYADTTAAVRRAQILAVDEAHNFLNLASQRSQKVLSNMADNVILFTATPINRGAADLLSLVEILGADNMEDEALAILEGLARRKGSIEKSLTPNDTDALRREIQRFTVRRTKKDLNLLVDRAPDEFLDGEGRRCRYPKHLPNTYNPGESMKDRELAAQIRKVSEELLGIAFLEQTIEMPEGYKTDGWSEETYLRGRLSAVKHLALHNVMATLRSSRAALVEHLSGSVEAMRIFGISDSMKKGNTGNIISKLEQRFEISKPECLLSCTLPVWISDGDAFKAACQEEVARYQIVLALADEMSLSREKAKALQLCDLFKRHNLILAFDGHLISLAVIRDELVRSGISAAEVIVAVGADKPARKRVEKMFHRDSEHRCIALCSDSMSEGVNLQGASAIVHLDMPSVVKIAEQRIGRVDRMDSPHSQIEAWWPGDSKEFGLKSDERFIARNQTVGTLIGSNFAVPDAITERNGKRATVVSAHEMIKDTEEAAALPWDGIEDAFSPVHALVAGENAIVPANIYQDYVGVETPVLSWIGLVSSDKPWAFFAISGFQQGAPKWMLIEDAPKPVPIVRLDVICNMLREKLSGEVENLKMDAKTTPWLDRFIRIASASERSLLPRRKQRALEQMQDVLSDYRIDAEKKRDYQLALRWDAIRKACQPEEDESRPDPDTLAEQWLSLVRPIWFEKLGQKRKRRRPLLLKDIKRDLITKPLSIEDVERCFSEIPTTPPLDERVAACIIGVPKL